MVSVFEAISWQQQVKYRYDIHFLLDQHFQLDFYSVSLLKQWSTDRHVTPNININLIPFVACLADIVYYTFQTVDIKKDDRDQRPFLIVSFATEIP
jgi:hypothetical protein